MSNSYTKGFAQHGLQISHTKCPLKDGVPIRTPSALNKLELWGLRVAHRLFFTKWGFRFTWICSKHIKYIYIYHFLLFFIQYARNMSQAWLGHLFLIYIQTVAETTEIMTNMSITCPSNPWYMHGSETYRPCPTHGGNISKTCPTHAGFVVVHSWKSSRLQAIRFVVCSFSGSGLCWTGQWLVNALRRVLARHRHCCASLTHWVA